MANPTPILDNINAFDATKGTTISFNIIGGTDIVRSNIAYIYDLSTNDLICTHLYISTESIHELPPNTDPSIVYASGKSSADFVNNKNYYLQIQTFTNTAGTAGGSGMSVAKTFWCLFDPALSVNAIPAAISTTSYNVGATYTTNITDVTIPVTNIIQQYKFDLYTATGTLVQTSGNIIGSGEQEGTSTTYNITYNFSGLVVNNSYYVVVTTTSTEGMTVSAQSNTFAVSIDTPTVGGAIVNNNACDGYISVVSNLSDEYGGHVSGEMASFETDSVNNVSSLKVNMEPIQDLHGYDHPWVGGAGINLFDASTATADSTWTTNGTQGYSADKTSSALIPVQPSTSYFVGFSGMVNVYGVYQFDADKNYVGRTFAGEGSPRAITTREDCYYVGLVMNSSYVSEAFFNYPSTETAYTPYSNICPISGWDEVDAHVTGFNVWDEKWELGGINTSGQETLTSGYYRSKNYTAVLPNTTYYFKVPTTMSVMFYDSNKDFIEWTRANNATVTTPSNCCFLRFRNTTANTWTPYDNDISINYPSTDHEYHAYDGQTVSQDFDVSLTPTSTDTDPYLFKAVGDVYGDRLEEDIVGGTVAWNQLCKDGDFTGNREDLGGGWSVGGNYGTMSYANNVGTYTVTIVGGASYNNAINNHFNNHHPVQLNHIYLCTADVYPAHNKQYFTFWLNRTTASDGENERGAYITLQAGKWQTATNIIKSKASRGYFQIAFDCTADEGYSVGDYDMVRNAMLIDLTAMFGTTIADYIYSLEQATAGAGVAWFRNYFPKDYYPYDPGTLRSVEGVSAHETVGFNQWDEGTADGFWNNDGTANSSSDYIRCKNKIRVVPGASYYLKAPTTAGNVFTKFYDVNGANALSPTIAKNTVFTIPDGYHYFAFAFAKSAYGTAYNHDICINISDPTRNGEYEPYQKHTYPLDSSLTLRGVPRLADGKLEFDGDVYKADGSVTRKYGAYTFTGNELWRKGSVPNRFSLDFAGLISPNAVKAQNETVGALQNLISSKYGRFRYENADKVIYSYGNGGNFTVVINDSSLSTTADVALAFKDTTIVYELATPTTETAEPFTNPQVVDNWGTEAYVTTGIVPVGHDSEYLTRDVFGGTLDLVTGVLTVDKAMVDLGTLNWIYENPSSYIRFYSTALNSLVKKPSSDFETVDMKCSALKATNTNAIWSGTEDGIIAFGATGTLNARIKAYTTAGAFKTAMDGVQLVYPLATPQTYQLTPHQIQTLVGQNNVWSDAGEVDVTFNLPISNLLVKRQDASDVSGNWLTLYSQPITQASDMDFTYIDFLNQYGKTYRYALVPLLTQQQGGVDVEIEGGYTVSDDVLSVFDGVFVANNNGSQKLKAATEYGDLETNQDVGVLTTIGNKYPFVVSNSNLNYHSGSISALIVPSDFYTSGDLDRLDIVERREAIEQFLTDKTAKILKDWNGNIWLITFVENVEVSFVDDYGMGLGTLSAKWVEIGDVNDQTDLQQTGLI